MNIKKWNTNKKLVNLICKTNAKFVWYKIWTKKKKEHCFNQNNSKVTCFYKNVWKGHWFSSTDKSDMCNKSTARYEYWPSEGW